MEERQVKQVIVFRKDLLKGQHAIRKGKFGAQCAHAATIALLDYETSNEKDIVQSPLFIWLETGYTKICLGIENDEELVNLYNQIKETNPEIPCALITDEGRTEFNGVKTNTCLGIGPWWSDEINQFTQNLTLL